MRISSLISILSLVAALCAIASGVRAAPPDSTSAGSSSASAVPAYGVGWKKTVIDNAFRAEGIARGDVNHDGKTDLLIGDSWYEAPNWTKHEIRKHGDYGDGARGYSEAMCVWADDVNQDGWIDQISIGFPGRPCFWYENPKGQPGLWKEHVAWPSACNETPMHTDLFGDGKNVLVMAFQPQGQMGWFEPGADPAQRWTMHPISEPSKPGKPVPGTQQFSHGLGVDDVNGDGRKDVLSTGGWWEQPEAGRAASSPWTFHPANLGEACADMIVYDVDGDGKRDVITSSAHKYGIWLHQRNPSDDPKSPPFIRHDLFPKLVSETHALIRTDIDGDGKLDFVTGKRYLSHGRSEPGSDQKPKLFWFRASVKDGRTSFEPIEIDGDSGIGTQFMVVDFNGDQTLDILVANKRGVFLFEQQRSKP